MNAPSPAPETAAWTEELLGGPCRFWWRGSEIEGSRVWTAQVPGGRSAVLKEPASRRKHEQEAHALGRWSPKIPGVLPRLLGERREPDALLIESLPGLTGDRALGSWELQVAAHRAAGAAVGRLHGLSVPDDDPLPLAEALPQRLDTWLRRAEALSAERREALRAAFGDGSAFEGLTRVPCHRDLEPRNWLVELDENRLRALRLIDLEHARLDCALADLVKLECGAWRGRPELREEFLEGCGGPLSDEDEDRLRRLVLLHLVATLVRATEDDAPERAADALAQLDERLAGGGHSR